MLVEKPLANTVAEAEKMLLAARPPRERGVASMVGFNYRRVPALAMARDLVASGRVGDVRQVKVAYLQDWLADAAAPMTWRLRKETAGSGALGDLASHAVDQVRFLLGEDVVVGLGHDRDLRPTPHGDRRHRGCHRGRRGVGHPAHVGRGGGLARGDADGHRPQELADASRSTARPGALAFDLERLNELVGVHRPAAGFTRMLVTEADQPYVGAWWPPGHVLGWDHTFTSQAADFLRRHRGRRRAVAVVRGRAGRAAGAGGDRGEWGTVWAADRPAIEGVS